MTDRTLKIEQVLTRIAATFIERETNKMSLITVTRSSISPDLKLATIYITVLPVEKEVEVIGFLKRNRSALRDFVKKRMVIKTIPFIDIEIDMQEKMRVHIDEIMRQ